MKTYQPKAKDIEREWHLIDAKGQVLGRMATQISTYLMGKHKPTYSAHMDSGDYVVVINCDKVELTGKKEKQKVYYSHSGYPGGFKETSYEQLKSKQPEKVIEKAVYGMLPTNKLRSERMNRLKVFVGEDHPYKENLK